MRLMILAGLLLSGCGAVLTPAAKNNGPVGAADTCNAATHRSMVGQDAASALALPEPKRLIGPTDAVTTDFNPARINVRLDDTDTIIAIDCG